MRIVIAGGDHKADFLVDLLLKNKHKLIVINKDLAVCNKLAEKYKINVIHGDATNVDLLKNSDVQYADILVALTPFDAKNFAICRMAEELFGIKKTIASIKNPANGPVYEALGVNKAISDSYAAASLLSKATLVNNLENYLDIAGGKASLSELVVSKSSPICNKSLADIRVEDTNICAIIRGDEVIIPRGQTIIRADDALLVLCPPDRLEKISEMITGEDE